jgi:hypothetical protein
MKLIKNTVIKIAFIYLVLYFHSCSPSPDNSQDPNGVGILTNLFMTVAGLDFKNQAVTSITGILYDTTGEPLANATLDLSASSTTREIYPTTRAISDSFTTTDADGVFYLKLKLGNFTINVTKADGTKIGSFTMDVSSSSTPPKVNSTGNFGVTGVGVAPISATPPSVTDSPLESISYSSNSYDLSMGIATTLPAKLTGGKITSCTVSPSLPTGLFLSNTTCRITGIPTVTQSSTAYTITASNAKSTVKGVLNLAVVLVPPTNLSYGVGFKVFSLNGANQSITPTFSGSALSGCTISQPLPSGLSLNTTTCAISGTPTVLSSQSSYTITATNGAGSTTATLLISVLAVPPTGLSYGSTSFILYKDAALNSLTPSYEGSPLTGCTVNTSLPPGLTLNTSSCAISGTPTAIQGISSYTITATNSAGSSSVTISFRVLGPPSGLSYTSSTLTLGVGISMTALTPTVTGTVTSYSVSSSLPGGLNLNSATGVISGTPNIALNSTAYTITASNPSGSTTFSLTISVVGAPSGLSYSSSNLSLSIGTAMTELTPTVTGGTVTSYTVSPSLPSGLSLNGNTGVISGTPTSEQSSSTYVIRATNIAGNSSVTISISVIIVPYVSVPLGLLKTGQTSSYVDYDDGYYQKGVARTFVTGGTTGLLWQRCSAGQNNDATCSGRAQSYLWDQANSYCSNLTLAGKTWRLPTVNELKSLEDYGKSSSPSIDTSAFPNTQSYGYWSSSTYARITSYAWLVGFTSGGVNYYYKYYDGYVRCVTGP